MKIIQANSPAKKKIETTASISIPQFEIGIEQFGEAFALKLNDHFITKKRETDASKMQWQALPSKQVESFVL